MFGLFKKLNSKGQWRKVSELSVGMEIAVPKDGLLDEHQAGMLEARASFPSSPLRGEGWGEGDVEWDEIVEIRQVGEERVYDIEVEKTHNFVGNNIFAHNTYTYAAILNGGNVGIGTASPSSLLHVAGNLELGSKAVASAPYLTFNTGSTTNQTTIRLTSTTTLASSYILTLPTTTPSSGQAILSDSDGNLYWGAAGSVTGSGAAGLVARWSSASALTTGLLIDNGTVSGVNATSSSVTFNIQGAAGSNNPFVVASSTGDALLTVLPSGSVGIGGTNASYKLNVEGAGRFANIVAATYFADLSDGNYYVDPANSTLSAVLAGNVGIGTTTPLARLNLVGSTTVDPFRVSSTTGVSLFSLSWYGGLIQNISSSTAMSIQNGSGSPVFEVDTTQSATNAGLDITAGGSQAGNLLNFYSSGGTFLAGFTYTAGFVQNIASTTAFSIQNGSGAMVFEIDSLNKNLRVATTASTSIASILTSEGDFAIGDDGLTGATDGRIWIRSRGTTFRFNSTGNSADYSEFFYQFATSSPGMVMSLDDLSAYSTTTLASTTLPSDAGVVKKTTKPYDPKMVGVVTTRGTSNNNPNDDRQFSKNFANVGLLGHVRVLISTSTLPIKAGDYITSSFESGRGIKAERSGYVLGQALEDFDPLNHSSRYDRDSGSGQASTSTDPSIMVFVRPGFQVINNTFVFGEDDGQLATHSTSSGPSAATNSPASFLVNQMASGNLLQLQQAGVDRLVVANDGSLSILANKSYQPCSTSPGLSSPGEEDCGNVLTVKNASTTLFSISSVGNVTTVGHLIVGKDTAGTAVISAGDDQVAVTFESPYASIPKVVVTAQGLPNFFYGVVEKTAEGFIIRTSQPVEQDFTFDWIALAQPGETAYQSSLSVASSPINPNNNPASSSPSAPSEEGTSQGEVAGTSTNESNMTNTLNTSDADQVPAESSSNPPAASEPAPPASEPPPAEESAPAEEPVQPAAVPDPASPPAPVEAATVDEAIAP